jgi:hypothetical protein
MPQPRAIVPDQGGIRAGLNSTGTTIPVRRLVKRSTTVDSIALAADGLGPYVGVTMAAILTGYAGDVQIAGRALVEAGAAVAIGALVMGGTSGKGITATAAKYAIGTANTAAAADGDIIEVDLSRSTVPA